MRIRCGISWTKCCGNNEYGETVLVRDPCKRERLQNSHPAQNDRRELAFIKETCFVRDPRKEERLQIVVWLGMTNVNLCLLKETYFLRDLRKRERLQNSHPGKLPDVN